ncbi:group II intron maturase-specific domain-containing protein [uncultured Paludibaculum sp.]|uniref:group II intron maturase-specific domain-containing protein n=1 Tax=uncultured Paludibaculum sp. TaxID=1765020 RepID=UPI00374D6EC7
MDRFKERVRERTRRTRGVSIERMAEELSRYLRGWIGYFGRYETLSMLQGLELASVGCELRSGSSGSEARCDTSNCGDGTWAKTSPRKRRAAFMARGGSPTARHSHVRCPMLTSTRSGIRDRLSADSSTRRTARCGPVRRMV